jgi:hypothetical protein
MPISRKGLMTARCLVVAFIACFTFGACTQQRAGLPRQDLDTLTREQITENRFVNAYDAVQAMRSNWLQTRGTDSFQTPSEVLVYLDNVKMGGVLELRAIPTTTIAFIRHFDGVEATNRWGVGHAAGVIQVSTFREGRR